VSFGVAGFGCCALTQTAPPIENATALANSIALFKGVIGLPPALPRCRVVASARLPKVPWSVAMVP
jgi:hypothetical protein